MQKVNWGVLGTAGIAKGFTIPGMQMAENCNLYAIAGRKPEKVQEYKTAFGFEKGYVSYDELLADPAVEAVYIPLANNMHYEWTMKALKSGKHVLCEKPMAPTAKQVEEMVRTARENGVILMEAFAYLHSPLIKAVKQELDQGMIGDILYMESAFVTFGFELSNIRSRKETFGGSMYDVGCYNTSLIQWMLGEEPREIKGIASFSDQGIDIHDNVCMEYDSGKRASFLCGICLTGDQRIDRWSIYGTKGYIRVEEEFNGKGDLSYRIGTEGQEQIKTVKVPHNYMLEVEQMGRCILEKERPYISNEFSMANSRTMDKILASIGYGTESLS